MPTIPQQQTIVQYIANVSQTEYTFAFYAPLPTDIDVYYQAANAQPVPGADILDYNVDYTVTYNDDPITGGTITLLFTPTTGYYLTINRNVRPSLTTDFSQARNFNGANLDAALDRLLLLCQQNTNYNLYRNLSYIINTYLPNATPFTQLPPLGDQQIWIGTGSAVTAATLEENPDVSTLRSELANAAPITNGARLVGYYNQVDGTQTTVKDTLDLIVATLDARKNSYVTTGMMVPYGGGSVPSDFMLCDGAAISRTTYAGLFTVLGTVFGVGDGSTTFNIPDTRRRTIIGSGGTAITSPANTRGSTNSLNTETDTLTIAKMPSHSHAHSISPAQRVAFENLGTLSGSTGDIGVSDFDLEIGNTGGGEPHNNMQPSLVVTMMVKYQ